jgi:NAD+ synthase
MRFDLGIDPAATAAGLADFISQEVDGLRRDGALIGLSGGIDSAVVATLAVRALGPERVFGLLLPEQDSDPESHSLARTLAARLAIRYRTVRLTPLLWLAGVYWQVPLWLAPTRRLRAMLVKRHYQRYAESLGEGETPFSSVMVGTRGLQGPWLNEAVAYHRVKVRLRTVLLHYHAELRNHLLLGTCNKTELAVGFFVKHGDAATDVAPLASLYKTQVRELAAYLHVPEAIIHRPPSPDVFPGLTDEQAMQIDYPTLDRVLFGLEKGLAHEDIARALGLPVERVRYVETLTRRAAFLREPPRLPVFGMNR